LKHSEWKDEAIKRFMEREAVLNEHDLIEQLCKDLNQAHDELMGALGADNPQIMDWPEWTPQANSIREAEKLLRKKLAKTDQWTLYPDNKKP